MTKMKNLTLGQIKKDNTKKFSEIKRITFDKSTLDIDVVFRPSKIDAAMLEYIQAIEDAKKDGVKVDDPTFGFMIGNALIVKHFTSIETDVTDYKGLIELLNALKDGGYLDKIMEAIDVNQITEFYIRITNTLTQAAKVSKQWEEENAVQQDEEQSKEETANA